MPSLHVNGTDMRFVERGTGVPLLLVHGTLGDFRSWGLQMEPFGAHYRTIAVSLRHCWPERWDGEGDDFTVQQHTKDIAAFIAALDAGPVHLMGHSRGGHIAFRVAQTFPDLVRKLVLVEPGGALDATLEPPHAPKRPPIALGPLYAAAAERIRLGEIDEGLAPTIDVTHGPDGWAKLPEESRQRRRDNARTLLGQIREQRAPFARSDAEAIRAPTLLVAGERSPESFHRILDGLESALRDVRRVVIPSASHGSNVDNPEVFNREALAFLEDR
ncbi:MAG: alpha/beta hydrolase [Roseiarcus sp.]|jgi:esterase|uniref:alpha/beta fold hydrolase n=1 Tax=Roseiarcus sp. TaxID=1969460 RepID=UPI003BB17514